MTHRSQFVILRPIFLALAFATMLLLAPSSLFSAAWPDQPAFDAVGTIEGEDIVVSGAMNVEIAHGQAKTVLRSGSDVRVKSGQARIDLVEGGDIIICGPAHFSVLKSADALTVALDSGTIHAHITRQPTLTVYTAQVQAKSLAIGDGPQDILVGFDAAGTMCVRAALGAARLERQLTGHSVIVPQNGDVLITDGRLDELRTASGHCSCESQVASAPPAPPRSPEVSVLATTDDTRKKRAEAEPLAPQLSSQRPIATEEPIYQVFMPPLSYNAKAKVQSDYDPKFIVLIRRVRVHATLIFRGRVEGDPIVVASDTAPRNPAPAGPQSNQQAAPKPATQNADDSVLSRVRSFLHRLWARNS